MVMKARSKAARLAERPEPSARERIVWMLEFLRRDVETLTPGQWLDLRHNVQHYLWSGMDLGAPDFNDVVRAWHQEVRRGLDGLAKDRAWSFREPLKRGIQGVREQRDRMLLQVYGRRTVSEALLGAAVDLLVEWYPQLRRCRGCGAWFLPRHGRQVHHDRECAARASWRRFAPKRKRDYHAEYARRLRRVAPGAKPQRRPRAGVETKRRTR